jgi:hypothetical protein
VSFLIFKVLFKFLVLSFLYNISKLCITTLRNAMLSINVMLSVHNAESRYAECHCAKCHCAKCHLLKECRRVTRVTRWFGKKWPNFLKSGPNNPNNSKIQTIILNNLFWLKFNKLVYKDAAIFGNFLVSKNHNEPSKK